MTKLKRASLILLNSSVLLLAIAGILYSVALADGMHPLAKAFAAVGYCFVFSVSLARIVELFLDK